MSRGRADLSLRPLAAAIGSSPRVLLYLFGSKDGLVRALLARARADELRPARAAARATAGGGLAGGGRSADLGLAGRRRAPRALLTLWADGYARSLAEPDGPWAGFAAATVADWLELLAAASRRRSAGHAGGAGRADAGTGRAARRAARPAGDRGHRADHARRRLG